MAVKIRISDMMDECCPEKVSLGTADEQLAQRIKEDVMHKIKQEGTHTKKINLIRTVLMVAVIATLMTVSAFAAGLFTMNRKEVTEDEEVFGYWRYLDEDGNVYEEQKFVYPDAGMVFSFTGPEVQEQSNLLKVKANWLPCDPDPGTVDKEGWSFYLTRQTDCSDLPYIVTASVVDTHGSRSVLNGKATVVKEEDWDNWHVLEIYCDYTQTEFGKAWDSANYILMFDEDTGWLINVKGTESMEVLEKIARNLEVCESDTPQPFPANADMENWIGTMDIGRG